jgi:putative FmdB family regulatory protein
VPTYSYRCTECDTAFDIQQAFTDDALTQCPTCQGRLRKVYNSIGVTFNGSGFYRTDSRSSGKSEGSSSGSGDSGSGSGSGSSSSSSESKPASTPAPAKKDSAPAKAAS